MKISKGRGIQFFRHPFFNSQKLNFGNIYTGSKQRLGKVFGFVNKKINK